MDGTSIENGQDKRSKHEHNRRPRCEPGEDIGRSTGTKGGLRALSSERAGEIGRTALLHEDDSNQEQANDYVDGDEGVKENLHRLKLLSELCPVAPGRRVHGAEEGT